MRFLSLIFLLFVSVTGFAKTGYVDMREAFQNTRQGQKVEKRLEKDLAKAKKEISGIEDQLKKDRAKLEQDIPLLSEEKRARRVQQFQRKVLESQKEAEQKRAALQQLEEELRGPILQKLQQTAGRIAEKEGYTVIHNKDGGTVWVSPKLDLTKKVSAQFNKKHK